MKTILSGFVLIVVGSFATTAHAQRACPGATSAGSTTTATGTGTVSPSAFLTTSNASGQQTYLQQMAYQQRLQQLYLQNQYLQNQLLEQRLAAEYDQQKVDRKLAARQQRREAEEARREAAKSRKNTARLAARE
jgi:hypothetical protein